MDYLDWVQHVFTRVSHMWADQDGTGRMVGFDYTELQAEFDIPDEQSTALWDAVDDLVHLGLIDRDGHRHKLTRPGETIAGDLSNIWQSFFHAQDNYLQEPELEFLTGVVELSQRAGNNMAWCEQVDAREVLLALGHDTSNEAALQVDGHEITRRLDGWLKNRGTMGPPYTRPRYPAVVRITRQLETDDQQLVRDLVSAFETTNVDFKRELNLGSGERNGEFARDAIGMTNVQTPGAKRYILVGVEDTGGLTEAEWTARIGRDRLEQILGEYAAPPPAVDYRTVELDGRTVGIVTFTRVPELLPHRGSRDAGRLKEGVVYTRHGSHTVPADDDEVVDLEREGERAREAD